MKHLVRICPFETGWRVELGDGCYLLPLGKDEALRKAVQVAREMHVNEVGIYDHAGDCMENYAVAPRAEIHLSPA